MDCDQSANEVTQTVHNFPELDLILRLAHNTTLCSDTQRVCGMSWNIMFYLKNEAIDWDRVSH